MCVLLHCGQYADNEPSLDFSIEGKSMRVEYTNLDKITLNCYFMDIELLFRYDSVGTDIRP